MSEMIDTEPQVEEPASDATTVEQPDAEQVLTGQALTEVTAQTLTVQQGGIQNAHADKIIVEQGGVAYAEARFVDVNDGGVGLAKAENVTVTDGGIGVVAAQNVEARDSAIFLAFAREIHGEGTKIMIDARAAVVLGLVAGVVISLFKMLAGRRRA